MLSAAVMSADTLRTSDGKIGWSIPAGDTLAALFAGASRRTVREPATTIPSC
jgi:hypothetical protein